MSRIGRLPIPVPSGVTVKIDGDTVVVKGPKGELSSNLPEYTDAAVEGSEILITRSSDLRQARANHGLARALINNMVVGVSQGFQKSLEVIGIGYRADVKGNQLVLNLGYSHLVEYPIPDGISISVDKQNKVTVEGIDKQQVGQVAAVIRGFRKPDHYKGKGVRYSGEHVRLKAGKSA
ncbi:MAG: 50S ribosomal protein L6 [Deltaproteobacteria bacterium]|nr:MAG: 50S ribosomal protein L6 [Deltaproteobacteria bacterium]